MKLAVVGLGLMGGSLALDLKESGFIEEVIGVDENESHVKEALRLKLIDRVEKLPDAVSSADIIILAVPVHAILSLLPKVLDQMKSSAIVSDVGSTKSQIVTSIQHHPKRGRYVAAHPMAGTEFSGPAAAVRGLFEGKAAVICDGERSDADAVQKIENLFLALKMRLIRMNSKEHDLHAAYVSHLSHISSFVLANTVLDKEKDVDAIFNLASGGFESTVRLAKSSPLMWAPIFEQNEKFIIDALTDYLERLTYFRDTLVKRDFNETQKLMERSNEIKRVLVQLAPNGGNAIHAKK